MNIIIIGAGVSGLISAIALHKLGHKPVIYERQPERIFSATGAGIVLWPNAVFVLDYLGLEKSIALKSGIIEAMDRYTNQGELLTSLNIHHLSRLMQFPSYSILYKDLLEILFKAAEDFKIDIFYNHNLIQIEEKNETTFAVFENAYEATADLIIGADGRMNSKTRLFVNGNNTPHYQGFVNWVGFTEHCNILYDKMAVMDIWGIGKRFGIVPVTDKKFYWAGAIRIPHTDKIDMLKAEIENMFNNWPDPVKNIIADTDQKNIKTIPVHDLHPITQWYRNNVLLIGDAAHASLPTSGQGACQAMEDAWHLMNAFKKNPYDITSALLEFNACRLNKTSALIKSGRNLANSIFNMDPDYCQIRNEQMKKVDSQASVLAMAKFWSEGLPIQ